MTIYIAVSLQHFIWNRNVCKYCLFVAQNQMVAIKTTTCFYRLPQLYMIAEAGQGFFFCSLKGGYCNTPKLKQNRIHTFWLSSDWIDSVSLHNVQFECHKLVFFFRNKKTKQKFSTISLNLQKPKINSTRNWGQWCSLISVLICCVYFMIVVDEVNDLSPLPRPIQLQRFISSTNAYTHTHTHGVGTISYLTIIYVHIVSIHIYFFEQNTKNQPIKESIRLWFENKRR